jgi:PAS domain S-box-containing protein
MSEELTGGESTEHGDGDVPVVDEPRVLLFMQPGRNRELLAETLGERYHVETATDSSFETGFDCCVLGHDAFGHATDAIEAVRDGTSVFLPFVLLVPADGDVGGTAWEYVDDVIELPVGKAQLHARIGNLIERRRTAVELEERSQELAATVADLRLKERAMDEAPVGITITDPDRDDNPMVYVNDRFETLTGYGRSEALGRNCRFLQGEDTDPRTRRLLRERIDAEAPVAVDIVNYRKNGERMWQKLDIAPVRDDDGTVTNFVGFQTEITDRKLRERRLEVLNRVLSHNLKNKMNVIEGHVALLEEEYGDDDDPHASLDAITDAARDLMGLAEAVRETEHIIGDDESPRQPLELTEHVVRLVNMFEDRYPKATIATALPEEPCRVEATGLIAAIEEAIDNAIKHDESSTPSVDVRVETRDDWVDVKIADEGPGIPEQEIQVLESGETPLNHADRLGIWLMYWAVTKAGGRFEVGESAAGGSVVTMSVPRAR